MLDYLFPTFAGPAFFSLKTARRPYKFCHLLNLRSKKILQITTCICLLKKKLELIFIFIYSIENIDTIAYIVVCQQG
jgi:hypothetical protein